MFLLCSSVREVLFSRRVGTVRVGGKTTVMKRDEGKEGIQWLNITTWHCTQVTFQSPHSQSTTYKGTGSLMFTHPRDIPFVFAEKVVFIITDKGKLVGEEIKGVGVMKDEQLKGFVPKKTPFNPWTCVYVRTRSMRMGWLLMWILLQCQMYYIE